MTQDLAQRLAQAARIQPAVAPPADGAADGLTDAVDRDRRAGIERIIELSRWIVLIFAVVALDFPSEHAPASTGANALLAGWALFNLGATLYLVGRRLPGPGLQLGMLAVDLIVATTLVYATGGPTSAVASAFYIVIIGGSLRFGLIGCVVCACAVSGFDVWISYGAVKVADTPFQHALAARVLLFLVVAAISGLLGRELVTSRARQLERSFELENAASKELREVERIKSEFMMLASHELRTPLTKIKAWLTLMQDAGDMLPTESRDEGLVELRMEAEHLARLTDNLLCIAQLESGEIQLRAAAVSVKDLIQEVTSRFIESADRGRFVINIAPDAKGVLGDEERLALVLACLVDNALKFSPDDEPVEITARRVVTRVHIEIHDNGRRIPDSHIDRVFASFYQVESPLVRQRGGFGVGLYLARQLTQRMGGKVWIDNTPTRGNTFVVALPVHL